MLSIDVALFKIKNNLGDPIEVTYVRGTGSRRGSIKKVMVLYGTSPSGVAGRGTGKTRKRSTFKASSTIPLIDAKTMQPLTLLISHIIAVGGDQVQH